MTTRHARSLLLALLFTLCISCAHAELTLPGSLTTIESGAFQGDTDIRRVVLPDTAESIGGKAFADSGLNEINFPENLKTVSPDAFENCGHIEAHASGDSGRALIAELAAGGCDIAWADEILDAVASYDLRAAAGQTIKRTFEAPETGRYTFAAGESVSVIRYNPDGSAAAEKDGSLSFNLAEGSSAVLGFRFADSTASGGFALSVSHAVNPMAALVYTPSLSVMRNGAPIREAGTNGSLADLHFGEVLAPSLTIRNSDSSRVAGQVFAELDGQAFGFALFFHNFSTFLGRAGIYLEDLFVLPEYRGKGCGTALLKRLAQITVERGCGRLEWSCLDWNSAKPMDEWTVYRLTGETLKAMAEK